MQNSTGNYSGPCSKPVHGLEAGDLAPVSNIVALMIRTGFWGHYTILTIRNPQNSIGNYLGPYSITDFHLSSSWESLEYGDCCYAGYTSAYIAVAQNLNC